MCVIHTRARSMLQEIEGVCRNCAHAYKILVLNNELQSECSECFESPFSVSTIKGLIYIVKNDAQQGVKIGLTTKTVEQRIKSLNTTGVAGSFYPIAIFPSSRPKPDEKRVHEKLKRKTIAKEHFDLTPVEAVLGAFRALNRRDPIFYDKNCEARLYLELKKAQIEMELRLQGSRKSINGKAA